MDSLDKPTGVTSGHDYLPPCGLDSAHSCEVETPLLDAGPISSLSDARYLRRIRITPVDARAALSTSRVSNASTIGTTTFHMAHSSRSPAGVDDSSTAGCPSGTGTSNTARGPSSLRTSIVSTPPPPSTTDCKVNTVDTSGVPQPRCHTACTARSMSDAVGELAMRDTVP